MSGKGDDGAGEMCERGMALGTDTVSLDSDGRRGHAENLSADAAR